MFSRSKTLIALACLGLLGNFANASEIKVLSADVFTNVLDDQFRDYERSSGDKVVFEYATAGKVRDRVQSGEQADVVIVTRPMIDQLEAAGKVARGTSVDLARSAVALVVRKGASKPDISSPDAFKQALKSAHSVSYPDPARGGATGVLVTRDLDRLGLTDESSQKLSFQHRVTLLLNLWRTAKPKSPLPSRWRPCCSPASKSSAYCHPSCKIRRALHSPLVNLQMPKTERRPML